MENQQKPKRKLKNLDLIILLSVLAVSIVCSGAVAQLANQAEGEDFDLYIDYGGFAFQDGKNPSCFIAIYTTSEGAGTGNYEEDYSDNFDDNIINTDFWGIWGWNTNNASTTETNQQLEANLPYTSENQIGGLGTAQKYDLSNATIGISFPTDVILHAQGILIVSDAYRDGAGVRHHENYPALYPLGYYIYKNHVYNTTRLRKNNNNASWTQIDDQAWQTPQGNLSIVINDGIIRFYDTGVEVYNEAWDEAIPTTLYVVLFMYADSTYKGLGTMDNFILQMGERVYALSSSDNEFFINADGGGIFTFLANESVSLQFLKSVSANIEGDQGNGVRGINATETGLSGLYPVDPGDRVTIYWIPTVVYPYALPLISFWGMVGGALIGSIFTGAGIKRRNFKILFVGLIAFLAAFIFYLVFVNL